MRATSPVASDRTAAIGAGDWLRAVLDLARAAGSDEPLESLFELVARTAADLAKASAVAVQVVAEDGQSLRIEGQVGLSAAYLEQVNEKHLISLEASSPYFQSPSSQAYRTGAVVAVDEVRLDDDYSPWVAVASMALRDGGAYRSMVAVPMVAEGERTGVIAVYSQEPGIATSELLALLQLLAEHAALAMTLARVRARERASVRMLLEANESLQRQQAVLDQADDLQRGLMRAVLESGDLTSIASTTANVMGLHIVLEDHRGDTLAASSPEGADPLHGGWLRSEQVLAARDSSGGGRGVSYVRSDAADGPADGWIIPLVLGDEVVAWLAAFGDGAEDDDLQPRLIERTAMAMTVELWREQSAREVGWRLSGDLLGHVLRDGATNPEDVSARAANLGYTLEGGHTVVLFQVAFDPGDVNAEERIRQAVLHGLERILRESGIHAVRAWRDGAAVVLLPTSTAGTPEAVERLARHIGRELAHHLARRDVLAVTSEVCEHLADVADAHRTVRGVAALVEAHAGERKGHGVRVIGAADLGVYSVLLSASRTPDLRRLRDTTLGVLEEYDERKGGNLLETLRAYLASGCRTQATATALFMHPNTVMYRLKTVERLTGLDLHQPDDALRAQLAVMIDDVVRH